MAFKNRRNAKAGLILGIGNPLLDILVSCDAEFVRKHNLQAGQTITNSDKYDALINELARQYKVKFIAGGSAQNTIRVLQWLFHNEPQICTFIGCIGKDFFGQCMRSRIEDEGVNVNYIEIGNKIKTGYCCVLAFRTPDKNNQQSTMITWLGAAHCFQMSHLNQYWNQVDRARIFIVEGYFLEVCPEAITKIADHFKERPDKLFCVNVGATYVLSHFWNQFAGLLPAIDHLFVFPAELQIICESMGKSLNNNQQEMLNTVAQEPPHANANKLRHVIMDCESVVWTACQDGSCQSYPVPAPDAELSKDNNGCRDAFVAGYLSGLMSQKAETDCINIAIYAAQEILKQDGCTIPKQPPTIQMDTSSILPV